jgi:amiloride-sensitive sodium channel
MRRVLPILFQDYCENTSLHGLKYVVDRKKKNFERLLWALFGVIFLFLCCCAIYNMCMKGDPSPIEISHVREIPFPTVTVCLPRSRKSSDKVRLLKAKLEHGTGELTEEEYVLYQ